MRRSRSTSSGREYSLLVLIITKCMLTDFTRCVSSRKQVVLGCGTLGTPQVLERSGVGSAQLLKKLNIPVVSDLPGVGEQYQDHYTTLQCK